MVDVILAKDDHPLVELEFEKGMERLNGKYAISGGISFPSMNGVGIAPEGAFVIIGEKDGIYYELCSEKFTNSPIMSLNKTYEKLKNRRYFYQGSCDRYRLDISRNRDVKWRPEWIVAPYDKTDEALNDVYSLLHTGKLKLKPNGDLYVALSNVAMSKNSPILEAAYRAISGLLKYTKRSRLGN